VSLSMVETVVVDAADMNSVTTNDCRQLAVSCCRVLRFRMAEFWGTQAGGYKWQYILIDTFSSFFLILLSFSVRV